MNVDGEESLLGKPIRSAREFIEDLCERINGFLEKLGQVREPQMQFMMFRGFIEFLARELRLVGWLGLRRFHKHDRRRDPLVVFIPLRKIHDVLELRKMLPYGFPR